MKKESKEFIDNMESNFEEILKEKQQKLFIIDKNDAEPGMGKILKDINYDRVFFDAYGDVYKKDITTGKLIPVNKNKGFEMFIAGLQD